MRQITVIKCIFIHREEGERDTKIKRQREGGWEVLKKFTDLIKTLGVTSIFI